MQKAMFTRAHFACARTPSASEEDEISSIIVEGTQPGAAARSSTLVRSAVQVSRTRWFGFLRRVFQYQNGSQSDLAQNPFNSGPWLAAELAILVSQIVGITAILMTSGKERPQWPLRIWVCGYDILNVLSLPVLYWRYRCSRWGIEGWDVEQQRSQEESRSSYLMNKSRSFLDLFFALWFVMGNVWVFDSRYGSLERASKLHALCVVLLTWNAIVYAFPFLLFLLLCCCVPLVSRLLGYNMNLGSIAPGASDDEIHMLPHCKFKQVHCTVFETDLPTCCICLSNYRDEEDVRQLPCSHIFHVECVDQWLRIISCCPLCKHEIGR